MYIIVIIIYIIIALIEIVPLYKRKQKKELFVYSIFFLTAFTLSMLICFNVKIPKIADVITNVVNFLIGKK